MTDIVRRPRGTQGEAGQAEYRASMRTELQKFGHKKEKEEKLQAWLFNEREGQEMIPSKGLGLNLTVSEDRALSALQILLHERGSLNNEESYSEAFKMTAVMPKLGLTYSDYYEAYGLKPLNGRYQGHQAQEALKALKSLSELRYICYERSRYRKGKKVYDIIRTKKPLIAFTEGFKDLSEEQAEAVRSGGDLPGQRNTRLLLELSPLLIDQIDTSYVIKPVSLHEEIKSLSPGKRPDKTTLCLINWLLTLDMKQVSIFVDNLAIKLRLNTLIEQRKTTKLLEKLQKALKGAKELGYLTGYSQAGSTLTLSLNSDKCQRVKKDQEAEA